MPLGLEGEAFNASPFCLKLVTYMHMAGIPYEDVFTYTTGPKGKMPYINDEGQIIADSEFIIDYLKQKYGDLDSHLNDKLKAKSLAIRRLLEEHLYWVIVYSRWTELENWEIIRRAYFANVPYLLRSIIAYKAKANVMGQLRGHGIGLLQEMKYINWELKIYQLFH